MGHYTTTAEVKAMRAIDLDRIEDATIDALISGYEAEIDSVLSDVGYTAPATGTDDVALIGIKVRKAVAADAWLASVSQDEAPDWVGRWLSEWSDFLSEFTEGTRTLTNQSASKRSRYAELGDFEMWEAYGEDDQA